MTKAELRKIYLAKNKSLSGEERVKKSLQIAGRFFRNFRLDSVHLLHLFLTIANAGEVNTRGIVSHLWSDFPHIRTIVPRINRKTDTLDSVEYGPDSNMQTNDWGISEPCDGRLIEPEEIDLVIVPLLCFDQRGHRVGYGKGYYDRFLAECRTDCLKVGVSYFDPLDEISDIHTGDVKLDWVVTPEHIKRF